METGQNGNQKCCFSAYFRVFFEMHILMKNATSMESLNVFDNYLAWIGVHETSARAPAQAFLT